MAAAPMNDEGSSDLQFGKNELETPKSLEADVDITAKLSTLKTSPPAPFTPSPKLPAKRKRLKPTRYEFPSTDAEKKHSPSKHKAVLNPSETSISLENEMTASEDIDAPGQISPTMVRAREVQSSLGNDHPSFIKTMLRSHVASCFWMGLPMAFCKSFLPKQDSLIVVEDENGQKCHLKFIVNKTGLSAGWRKFAIEHKLLEGDVLIFQLVESCKFKVYIVRAKKPEKVDGALNLINHDAHTKNTTPATVTTYSKSKVQKKHKISEPPTKVLEGSPKPNLPLEKVKTFKDFHIMVNNRCIDSELSKEIRINYHKLCIVENQILHDSVRDGLYYKLVAGMIGETVNIAKMIKECNLTTTKVEFDTWDSSLKSFELIGMEVGFIRDKIRVLAKFVTQSESYMEAKEEQKRNANEIKLLEVKVLELKECNRKIEAVVGGYEVEFKKKVDAPW